ncbi:hypothetical protein IMG5_202320 [Ichthyophthirius multifiliis]|uniref:Ion transport domain-containing protein n=1 Tax=Ichthyophthirius multifiliis TaxID=5932 RepID=G0R652_ICHMU|nr:hypothetical protein IMG5_202320 [Ichthyophthirius multifiliis]EGR27051.1 hypothetical protein IMG5_202320 [Ichthyophthirius multifiliis]|eukprot:XP_004023935.1 hypothetical protein IMG5_202320 [Ichthyophthirius multifiliis]
MFFIFSLIGVFGLNLKDHSEFLQYAFFGFILDFFFQLNTGIVKKGEVLNNRKEIAFNYFKNYFFQDTIAIISLVQILYFYNKQNQILNIISYIFLYLKISILRSILERLEQLLALLNKYESLIDLIRLLFTIGTICHVFCLLWYGLAVYEIQILKRDDTWLNSKNLIGQDIYTKYIYSFYYIAVTMITVGYGDITPQNQIECTFTVITMFFTGVVYAYSLNCIGNILQNINEEYKDLKNDIKAMHKLMSDSGVQQSLRVKIINYLEYLYKESNQKKNIRKMKLQPNYLNNSKINQAKKYKEKFYKKSLQQKSLLKNKVFNQYQIKWKNVFILLAKQFIKKLTQMISLYIIFQKDKQFSKQKIKRNPNSTYQKRRNVLVNTHS